MNNISHLQLGLRTLGLVALVAFSTAVLVKPELIGGAAPAAALPFGAVAVVAHH